MSSLTDDDRANLTAYLDGELDEAATQALEAKLNQDPEARAEVEALKRTWSLLDFLPKPQASTDFTHRTIDRLEIEKRKPVSTAIMPRPTCGRWAGRLAWTTAAAVLLVVGFLLGQRMGTRHDDAIVKQLDVIQRWRNYETIDDIELLKALDHPDLFGDEGD
jgi:anti-sigma factor RsiW